MLCPVARCADRSEEVRTVHRTGSGDTSQLSHAARAFCTDIRKVDTVYNETSVLCIVIITR